MENAMGVFGVASFSSKEEAELFLEEHKKKPENVDKKFTILDCSAENHKLFSVMETKAISFS